MADRSAGEIRELVHHLEGQFNGSTTSTQRSIWMRNDQLEAFVGNYWDVAGELPKAELPRVMPIAMNDVFHDINLFAGKLNDPIRLSITPHTPLKRDQTRADDLEIVEANRLIRLGISNGSPLYQSILRSVCYRMYAPVWLEWQDYQQPQREKDESSSDYLARVKQYEEEWFGWSLTLDPVRTTSFMETLTRGVRQINTALRHRKLPYLDLARRYSETYREKVDPEMDPETERALCMTICKQEFSGIRADAPVDFQKSTGNLSSAEVWEVADGSTMSHYIAGLPKGPNEPEDFRMVGTYPVPLGRVPLFVFCGVYNGSAPLEDRYLPLLLALLENYRGRDKLLSLIGSYMANARMDAIEMTDTQIEAYAGVGESLRAGIDVDDRHFTMLPGKPVSTYATPEQIQLAEMELNSINAEIQRQRGVLNNPAADNVIEAAPVSAVLRANEEEQLFLKATKDGITTAIRELLDCTTHMAVEVLNPHYEKGSAQKRKAGVLPARDDIQRSPDVAMYATTSGGEGGYLGRTVENGKRISLGPEDVDFPYTREVSTYDEKQSAVEARAANARERWDRPDGVKLITYDELIGQQGITDVEGYKNKLRADQMFQITVPQIMSTVTQQADQFVEAFLGAQPGSISSQSPQVVPQQQPGAGSGSGDQGGQGLTIHSPSINSAEGQAVG